MRVKMLKVGLLAGVAMVFVAGTVLYTPNETAQASMRLHNVWEMLAALLLFSIGFAALAVVISILFLLDRGLFSALAWTGHYTAHAAQRLHRGWVQVEQFGRKHFHRSDQPVER
jgi:hypothetical protein